VRRKPSPHPRRSFLPGRSGALLLAVAVFAGAFLAAVPAMLRQFSSVLAGAVALGFLTESILVAGAESTARLDLLRADGVRVAIDDFGTGYSSLAYLVHLPVDVLKIDRTFIATAVDTTLMRAILQLADGLSLQRIAEGVETEEQAATLRSLGCSYAQGYLFSRPVPPAEIADRLASGRLDLGAARAV
jgi:EAL domain-containing protein (putative c-di-GMP-specific phosphodiesterase class I)